MLNSYSLRNQINDRFFQKENINKPVVATVTKSLSGQSIILTTMSDFSADYMIQNKSIWQDLVACKRVEKDIHWSKIVIHGVPVEPFSTSDGLHLLKEKIEIFNSQLKLMKSPA